MMRARMLILFGVLCVAQIGVCGYLIVRWEAVLRFGDAFRFVTQPVDPSDAFRGRYVAINLEQNHLAYDDLPSSRQYGPNETVYARLATNAMGFAFFDQLLLERPAAGVPYLKTTVNRVDENMYFQPGDILNAPALAHRILFSNDTASVVLRLKMQDHEREPLSNYATNSASAAQLPGALSQFLNRMLYDQDFADRLLGHGKVSNVYADQRRMRRELVQAYPAELAPAPAARVYLNLPFDRFYMEESLAPRAEDAYRQNSRTRSVERTYITVRILHGQGVIENLWIGAKPIAEYLKSAKAP